MKTLLKKIAFFVVMMAFSFGLSTAQTSACKSVTPKPELKTMKAFNTYVKTIDWKAISKEDKLWLERKYNALVDAIDRKYHSKTNESFSAYINAQQASYSTPKKSKPLIP